MCASSATSRIAAATSVTIRVAWSTAHTVALTSPHSLLVMGFSADIDTAGNARAAVINAANTFLLNMSVPLLNGCAKTVDGAPGRGAHCSINPA